MSTTGRNDHGISQVISHKAIPTAPRLSAPQAAVPAADAGGPGELASSSRAGPCWCTPTSRRSPRTSPPTASPPITTSRPHRWRTGGSPGSRLRRPSGLSLPAGSGSSAGSTPSSRPSSSSVPGAILGGLPVGSPFGSAALQGLAGPAGFIPQQIQTAYGLSTGSGYNNDISFGTIKGDGTGQTIGIYEEGYNPAFVDTSAANYSTSALAVFDKTFGLPDPPSLTFVDHTGAPMSSTNNGSNNPDFLDYGAGPEIALDIESAHAMAPGAKIVVLCAVPDPDNYYDDIPLGIATLAGLPGVSVISSSYTWYLDDFGEESLEQSWDTTIIQPALAANPDVSVFDAAGDNGAFYGVTYPSASPEVVAVGGTSLSFTQTGQWSGETGWVDSGGGYSYAFALPAYQQGDGFSGNVNDQRTNPDVAADADPNTGVAIYDPYDFGTATPWAEIGGTSLATPLWAGMAAVADQGRVAAGGTPLGSTAMLTDLYDLDKLDPGDFHDVTQGNNGYIASPGYDLVTGLGTPKANLLIPDLVALGLARKSNIATEPPPTVVTGATFGIIATATDAFGVIDPDYDGTATLTLATGPSGATFKTVTAPVIDGQAVFSNLSLTKKGSGYTFKVAMTGLTSTVTSPVAVIAPQAGTGYFYPLPVSNGLGADVAAADTDSFASNVITLSVSSIPYSVTGGQLVIDNGSNLQEQDVHHRRAGRVDLRHQCRIDQPGLRDRGDERGFGGDARPVHRRRSRGRRRHPGGRRGPGWRPPDRRRQCGPVQRRGDEQRGQRRRRGRRRASAGRRPRGIPRAGPAATAAPAATRGAAASTWPRVTSP